MNWRENGSGRSRNKKKSEPYSFHIRRRIGT